MATCVECNADSADGHEQGCSLKGKRPTAMTSEPTAEAVCAKCGLTERFRRNHARGSVSFDHFFKPREEPEADAVAAALEGALTKARIALSEHIDEMVSRRDPPPTWMWQKRNELIGAVIAAAQVEAPRVAAPRVADEELWERSKIIGAAVNEITDRIMERGFTEKRFDLVRWLTWVASVAAHPERHRALAPSAEDGGEA